MNSKNIILTLEDWQKNAGIVGFVNILEYNGYSIKYRSNLDKSELEKEIIITKDEVIVNKKCLENFSEYYFDYLINRYKAIISVEKIMNFGEIIDKYLEDDFKSLIESKDAKKELELINKNIEDVKKYTKSNSYKKVYDLIDTDIDMLAIEKQLKKINPKKKESIKDVMPKIKESIMIAKSIIDCIKNNKQLYKYIAAKNVIYTVIKNCWNGVCFLNAQTKEKDMLKDYNNYFVKPAIEYIEADKSKYKYNCTSCNESIKNLNDEMGFLNNTGFDTARKPSHIWNYSNDIAICPICKLIYSCMPAGVSIIINKGIFVNSNAHVKSLIETNNKIYHEMYKENNDINRLTYKALIRSIQQEFDNKIKYEIADIQVIQIDVADDNVKYKFNILSKKMLEVIRKSNKELTGLTKTSFKEDKNYYYVYNLVMDRLFNNQNQYTLVHKLLYYKLSNNNNCYYGMKHVEDVLEINQKFLEEIGVMQTENDKIVKNASAAGYYLRMAYAGKFNSKEEIEAKKKTGEIKIDKLNGINYRLLNALKTNNVDSFMDTVLNCYLYVKQPVSKILLETLKQKELFKTVGYAFVTGLMGSGYKKEDKVKEGNK